MALHPEGDVVALVGGRFAVRAGREGAPPGLYRAVDTVLERPVDVAILPEVNPARRASIKEILRQWVHIDHLGLLPLYDFGDLPARPYLVFAATGGVLAAERMAAGPVAVDIAASWVRALLTALAALHDAGQVHGALNARAVVVESRRAALLPVSLSCAQPRPEPGRGQDVSAVIRLLACLIAGPSIGERSDEETARVVQERLDESGPLGQAVQRLFDAELAAPGTLEARAALALLDGAPRPGAPEAAEALAASVESEVSAAEAPNPAGTRVVWPAWSRALLVVTLSCLGALLGLLLRLLLC